MTLRDISWFAAGAILAAGVSLYLRRMPQQAAVPAPRPAMAPAVAQAKPTMKVPPMEQSTAQLAARLTKNGGTAADWKLLGQAYDFLGRKEDAKAAYAKAAAAPAK
jgi:cytochrome c-type biogenesis protein CcmH/NrfG